LRRKHEFRRSCVRHASDLPLIEIRTHVSGGDYSNSDGSARWQV
jgi:hypothetical protein